MELVFTKVTAGTVQFLGDVLHLFSHCTGLKSKHDLLRQSIRPFILSLLDKLKLGILALAIPHLYQICYHAVPSGMASWETPELNGSF